ncbi:MAG: LytTR family DNA-binding domain-containing protein [Bacillota bacterium]|nr:LytTR family DNA-binding domain-containing protein [Bacillota bacterium]
MSRIAIVDDEKTDRELVKSVVERWADERGVQAQVSMFSSAESFLFCGQGFDIYLLDIEMTGMDGVTLARRIRQGSRAAQIVFITGYSEYILEGYDVEALHYIVKPFSAEKLCAVLNRALEKQVVNAGTLDFECAGEMLRLPLYEVMYIDVQKNNITIHTAEKEYMLRRTLSSIEPELTADFFRVGRALIVNLRSIRKVTKSEIHLSRNIVLPIPRGAYEPLNRAIINRG